MSYLSPQDVEMYSGDTLQLIITVTDSDTGLAKNLSGATAIRWELAKSAKVPSTLIKTLVSGITITNAAMGELRVDILPADTASLKGDFIHELEIIDFAGQVNTVLDGKFTILLDVAD